MAIRKISTGAISTKNILPAATTSSSTSGSTSSSQNPTVDYLIVGGGGAGSGQVGGGGGGGGVLTGNTAVTPGVSYTVTVGAGGANTNSRGNSGEHSFFNNIYALGGTWSGFFGETNDYTSFTLYGCGASSGGQGGASSSFKGKTILTGQGNRGGNCVASAYTAAGGGGAGGIAPDANNTHSTIGGVGIYSSISGSNTCYGGGGNGAAHQSGKITPNTVAVGGGGLGGITSGATGGTGTGAGANGQVNSGGGGGGGGYTNSPQGGKGGSGIVILSYPTSFANASTTGSPTYSESGGNRIFKFTGSGTITF